MKNAKYKTEFPSFGELDVTIPAGFEDTSWANHTHPTFTSDALRLEIWIDYADKGDREPSNVERPRFHVYRIDDEGCVTSDALVASNDWSDVEVFVAEAVPFYVPNGRYLAAGLEDWQTGGGCTAWGGNLRVSDKRESDQPSGSFIWKNFRESDDFRPYVMVTDSEGGVIPEDPSARVTVGLYLSEESEGDACFEFPSTDEAIAFLRTLPFTTERSDDPGRPKSNAETLEATGIPAVLDRMRAGTFDAVATASGLKVGVEHKTAAPITDSPPKADAFFGCKFACTCGVAATPSDCVAPDGSCAIRICSSCDGYFGQADEDDVDCWSVETFANKVDERVRCEVNPENEANTRLRLIMPDGSSVTFQDESGTEVPYPWADKIEVVQFVKDHEHGRYTAERGLLDALNDYKDKHTAELCGDCYEPVEYVDDGWRHRDENAKPCFLCPQVAPAMTAQHTPDALKSALDPSNFESSREWVRVVACDARKELADLLRQRDELVEALGGLNGILEKIQGHAQRVILPASDDDAMSEHRLTNLVLELTDGPEQRKHQGAARTLLARIKAKS